MRNFIREFASDESGASVVEGLLMIGVAAAGAVAFGAAIVPKLKSASDKMGTNVENAVANNNALKTPGEAFKAN